MRTKLLIFLCLAIFTLNAQTTHDLDWFAGIGSSVDLTIDAGDTVRWTWTSPNHTVENNPTGTSVETFDSGFLGPNGSTFSYTFTVIGSNDYMCGVHGAVSMSGTITVQTLGIEDFSLKDFLIKPNPSSINLNIELPNNIIDAKVEVYDVLGKQIYNKEITKNPINITDWSRGVYLVRVSTSNVTHTKRFVKQ